MKHLFLSILTLMIGIAVSSDAIARRNSVGRSLTGHHGKSVSGHRVHYFGGFLFSSPYWGPAYYPHYSTTPAVVYIEQPNTSAVYWYYCLNPGGYYPDVPECPDGWIRVMPQPHEQNQ